MQHNCKMTFSPDIIDSIKVPFYISSLLMQHNCKMAFAPDIIDRNEVLSNGYINPKSNLIKKLCVEIECSTKTIRKSLEETISIPNAWQQNNSPDNYAERLCKHQICYRSSTR